MQVYACVHYIAKPSPHEVEFVIPPLLSRATQARIRPEEDSFKYD